MKDKSLRLNLALGGIAAASIGLSMYLIARMREKDIVLGYWKKIATDYEKENRDK